MLYKYESCYDDPGDDGVTACSDFKWGSDYPGTIKNVGAGQPNSHFWWRVKAKDAAGNWSVWSESRELIIDNDDPVTTITSPTDNVFVNESILIEGSSTDELSGVDFVNLYYSPVGENNWVLITTIPNGLHDEPFAWDYTWSPLSEGTFDIKAAATDRAGNEENSAYAYSVTYDVTPPIIDLLGDVVLDINQGGSYDEPGYQESDNTGCVKNIEITDISGVLNEPGTYAITYVVVDCADNRSEEVQRTINVNRVSSGGSGGGGGGGSGLSDEELQDLIEQLEEVAGASTQSLFSPDDFDSFLAQILGGAGTASAEEILGDITGEGDETLDENDTDNSALTASALGVSGGLDINGWHIFWAIVILILLALLVYILYKRKEDKKTENIQ